MEIYSFQSWKLLRIWRLDRMKTDLIFYILEINICDHLESIFWIEDKNSNLANLSLKCHFSLLVAEQYYSFFFLHYTEYTIKYFLFKNRILTS